MSDQKFKLGDIVVKKEGYNSTMGSKYYAGSGYGEVDEIFRIGDIYRKNNQSTAKYNKDAVFDDSGIADRGGIFMEFVRHATPDEKKTLKKMEAFERLKDELFQERNNKRRSEIS